MHRPGNRAFHGLPCAWSPANTRFRGFSDRGPIRPRARPGRAKPARRGGQCAGISRRAAGASSFRDRRRPGGQVAGRATMGTARSNPSPAISSRVRREPEVTLESDLARVRPTTSRSSDGRAEKRRSLVGCQACRSALIFITRSSFRSKQSPPAFSSARLNSSVSRSWSSFDSSFLAMG